VCFNHSERFHVGQNLYNKYLTYFNANNGAGDADWSAPVNSWVGAMEGLLTRTLIDAYYHDGNHGSFTQIIWAETRFVGCGVAKQLTRWQSGFKAQYTYVCNYGPA
jgi:hypothetical protein